MNSHDLDLIIRAYRSAQARARLADGPAEFLATYGLDEDAMSAMLPGLCQPAMNLIASLPDDDEEALAEATAVIVANAIALGLQVALERALG